jgi:hypothetical protein
MPYHFKDWNTRITAEMAEAEPLEDRLFFGPPPDRTTDATPPVAAAQGQLSFTWDADDAPRIVRPEIRAAQKLLIMPSGRGRH